MPDYRRTKYTARRMLKVHRLPHPNRIRNAPVIRVYPDEPRLEVVEVRVSRTRRQMQAQVYAWERSSKIVWADSRAMGSVVQRCGCIRKQVKLSTPHVLARMFLNEKDIQRQPSEIIAHEATHAAMAWARYTKANLHSPAGEEVLAYAVGRMVAQLNAACWARGYFP